MKSEINPTFGKIRKPDKKVFSFFIIAFPTILIIVLALLLPASEFWWAAFLYIAIAVYQFLMLKQFLDNYYDILE